jgi:hypothetical protein
VFALGATLLYALTGQPPYGHCDPRVILQRAAKGRVAAMPPGIDRELRRQLEPMLRRDPRRRPSAAAALAGAGGRPGDGPDGTVVAPATPRPRRPWIAPLAVTLVAVSLILGWLVARRDDGDRAASATGAETPAPSEAPPISACRDLPYQPCGQQPAAGTDGTRCIDDRADYDENVHNGCEARPDSLDGETFDRRLTANLVPADDVDSYPTPVRDNLDLLCDGTFRVSLTAPPGTAMRLEVLAGTNLVDSAVSRDGEAATLTLVEPSCFGDDTGTLTTRVRWVGAARSGESYELTRSGSF